MEDKPSDTDKSKDEKTQSTEQSKDDKDDDDDLNEREDAPTSKEFEDLTN